MTLPHTLRPIYLIPQINRPWKANPFQPAKQLHSSMNMQQATCRFPTLLSYNETP
jgi:hypothetical protein